MVNYREFINIFDKDYNLDCFYILFLKKKKEAKKILKEDVDDKFLEFLIKNKIEREEEIKVFLKLYNDKLNLNSIYLSYRGNFISLKDLENIKDMDNLKYIVLNEYKDYLKVNIDKIDNVDLNNILVFIIGYYNFYTKIDGKTYLDNINLNNSNIERDLTFLKILGIEEVKGDFDCRGNKNLKSLRGCPSWVGGSFYCYECGLEELGMEEGVIVKGYFSCSNNKNLKNLKNSPSFVGGDFICDNCGLEELGMREGVIIKKGGFSCRYNYNLKSLKGSPIYVGDYFICRDCGLEELNMPKGVKIGGYFDCRYNYNLKSLKGCPSYVGGDFICNGCNLDEIDLDVGITIEKDLICLSGNNVTKEQVEEYIKENNIKLGGEIK